uniref:RNA-directed RNA polymerase L n=1 Tax=Aulacomnium heterostichum bunyavirus 1 TaxID=2933070 RepID=A0A9C7GWG9_9VIRU|nr:RNA-dependent RNA polymerase [Aulacomnium heterostichum bunyavirus 1]CAI5383856.1 RNA-dependent RNA polymerase [Aulacomnium heterostichum bunyavirus 1]
MGDSETDEQTGNQHLDENPMFTEGQEIDADDEVGEICINADGDEEENEEEENEEDEEDGENEEEEEEEEEEENEVETDPIGSDDDAFENIEQIPFVDEEEILEPNSPRDPQNIEELPTSHCCRYLLKSPEEFEFYYDDNKMMSLIKTDFNLNLECIVNEIRNVTAICDNHSHALSDNSKMNILDAFIRNRHEVLSNKAMDCIGMGMGKTDVRFNEVFPIASKRTPDFITKVENQSQNENKYVIIEFTAVSDVEKAAIRKGDTSRGYVSKYSNEISQIETLGFEVNYIVVIFDVFDPNNSEHEDKMKEMGLILGKEIDTVKLKSLNFLRKEYCESTRRINKNLSSFYNVLFGDPYSLSNPSRFEDLEIFGEPEKEYKGKYVSVGISNGIYDRIVSFWPRMIGCLNRYVRFNDESDHISLCFNFSKNNFDFQKNKRKLGSTAAEWYEPIYKNWYTWVIERMKFVNQNVEVSRPKSDFEFFNYEKDKVSVSILSERNPNYFFNEHPSSTRVEEGVKLIDFSTQLESRRLNSLKSKYEDEDYEDKIINALTKFDENINDLTTFSSSIRGFEVRPLCSYRVSEKSFQIAVESYKKKLDKENEKGEKVIVDWVKQPFIYPLYKATPDCFVSYRDRPSNIDDLMKQNFGGYTNTIIETCARKDFQWGTRSIDNIPERDGLQKELAVLQRSVTDRLKTLHREKMKACPEGEKVGFPKMKELPDHDEVKKKISDVSSKIREIDKSKKHSKKVGVIKLTSKNRTPTGDLFRKEMSHFKSKEVVSNYKGVGNNHDFKNYDQVFKNLIEILLMPSLCKPEESIYNEYVSEDCRLLEDLKNSYVDHYSNKKKMLEGTNLYSSCCFISRLCHTLLYLSQTTFNTDNICVDNLGTTNSVLLVKGGKKIFPTKRSKLFRLIFPTYRSVCNLYFSPGSSTSFETFKIGGLDYIVTPWMNLHETVLTDGLTIHSKVMGFSILSNDPGIDFLDSMRPLMFNILLCLHNRRQTETMLHNLRYVFMNCMSEISAIEEMLQEFAGFNYDFFQFWVRGCLNENFLKFSKSLKSLHDNYGNKNIKGGLLSMDLRHPFTGYPIKTLNDLAYGVYSTYLMSKAPTTQSLEQVSNMKSILETHDEFCREKGDDYKNCFVTLDGKSLEEYYNELFKSDFNFDPKFCVTIGKFFGDSLSQIENLNTMQQKWDRILDESWDEMSNTKGLRGSGDSDFFGSKGYYVVYKSCLEKDPGMIDKIKDIIFSEKSESHKRTEIGEVNQTYRQKYSDENFDEVVFHVVDKKQRGGKREIYVMDMDTKIHQQTIEKFSASICKLLPSEMISIPSNKRLSSVHSKVFEDVRESKEKYYWVLDCRKWAPKSVIEKFMLFLSGARESLPSSFVYHSYNFFNLLRNKKVYTRKYVQKIISKNSRYPEHMKNYLIEDKEKDGYFLNMKHSWVMGIFNYFSSMMHVATQMYSSHIIRRVSITKYDSTTILHMIAHSDDSAGRLLTDNSLHLYRSSLYYEIMMHSSNHLLSKKKCNQGKIYYEFLSILYIGGELLSLLSKFIGVFNFHPSDKGYCVDINDSYSKCVELILNGATLSQSYIAMKIQSEIIHRFYFNSSPGSKSYDLPTNLMGVPDPHPLMVLIMGSDADTFRIMSKMDDAQKNLLVNISEFLAPLGSNESGFFNTFITQNPVRKNKKLKEMVDEYEIPDEIKNSWTLNNVSFKNTGMNCIQFISKLSDPSFISALQDETIVRRISRAFYHRSHNTTKTAIGLLNPKEILEAITILRTGEALGFENLKEPYKEILSSIREETKYKSDIKIKYYDLLFGFLYNENKMLYKYFDMINFDKKSLLDFQKTCKPIYMKIQKTTEECPVDFDPSVLVSWVKEPQYRWALPNFKGLKLSEDFLRNAVNELGINIEDMDEQHLFKICRKIKRKSTSEYYCYSNMPGGIREITTYQDFLGFLSHNSFSGKYINGLNIQFGKTLNLPLDSLNKDFELPDIRWTNSFLLLFSAILKSDDFEEKILELNVDSPYFIYQRERTMYELFDELQDYWIKRPSYLHYFKTMFAACESMLNRNEYVSSDILVGTSFHCFIKRQFMVDNVWLGVGKMFVSVGTISLVLVIRNISISHLIINTGNHTFTKGEIEYLNMCLVQSNLPTLNQSMKPVMMENRNKICFGIDGNGYYHIGISNEFVACLECLYSNNLDTYLSNPQIGVCKSIKRGKYLWTYDQEGTKVDYVLNFYPYEPTESTNLLRTLIIDSKKNREILMGKQGDSTNILLEMCYKELDLELNADFNEILIAPTHTKIYKILQMCKRLRLCEVNFPEVIQGNSPARSGSFLLAMINYSKHDRNFDFRWQHTTTPEYLAMKSSQSDSFVTELLENIRAKYYSWYDSDDRRQICKSLMSIQKNLSSIEGEKDFVSAACTWGFVGVSGAIDELENTSKVENFQSIRFFQKENPFSSHFSGVFLKLLKAIFKTLKESLNTHLPSFKTEPLEWFRIDSQNLNYHIMSIIHSIVLLYYNPDPTRLNLFGCHNYIIKVFLTEIMRNENIIKNFEENIRCEYFLSRLPVRLGLEKEWLIVFNTLLKTHLEYNKVEERLKYETAIQRDSNFELPFVKTKNILSDYGIKISASKVYHQGAISRQMLDYLLTPRRLEYENQTVYMKMEKVDLSGNRDVQYNKDYWVKHPLSECFLDSDDFEDMEMELQSEEPDLDEIERVLEEGEVKNKYDYEGLKRVKISVRGRLKDVLKLNFKLLTMFGSGMSDDYLNKIRQSGENIIIMSDNINISLLMSDCQDFMFFRSLEEYWIDQSITYPRYTFFLVITRRFKLISFWEKYLNSVFINQEEKDWICCCEQYSFNSEIGSIRRSEVIGGEMNWIDLIDRMNKQKEEEEEEKKKEEEERTKSGGEASTSKSEEKRRNLYEIVMNSVLDDEVKEKIKRMLLEEDIEPSLDRNTRSLEELIEIVLTEDSDKIIEGLRSKLIKLKETPISQEEQEMLYQVPSVFGGGKQRRGAKKMNLLKDPELIAEFECIQPGLIWLIVTGGLFIGQKMLKRWKNQMKIYSKLMKDLKNNKKGKIFLLNMCRMFLNDANTSTDEDSCKEIWDGLYDKVAVLMIDDEEEDDSEDDIFKDPTGGRIRYGISGEHNLYTG